MIRNARFWVYVNGWVKLTLRPGQHLAHFQGGATDEGYSRSAMDWEHHGDHVSEQDFSEGRDCDGRTSDYSCWVCPLHKLQEKLPEEDISGMPPRPEWEKYDSERHDFAAEAAGY